MQRPLGAEAKFSTGRRHGANYRRLMAPGGLQASTAREW